MSEAKSTRATTHLANAITAAIFLVGIGSTIITSRVSEKKHDAESRQVFEAECEAMRTAVEQQITLFFDVLDSISQLHQLSENISSDEFEEFTRKGLQFQKNVLSSYGFVQRMPHNIRDALAQDPQSGLIITERAPDGSTREAAVRPEYYPLVYQHPARSLGTPLGTDMATLPGAAEAIMQMNNVMGPVTAPGLQVREADGSSGYFAFSPIFQLTKEQRTVFSGFTVSILWPQRILQKALEGVSTRDILVRFYDPDAFPPNEKRLGGSDTTFSYLEPIRIADRQWIFEAAASQEYIKSHQSALPLVIRIAGTAITLLATITMVILANRTRRIERVVQERTRELKTSNALLSEAMKEQLRLEGEILDISEREKQQLGHDLHDSLGQKLTGAIFLARALGSQIKSGENVELCEQADRITETLKDSVAQVRRMAKGLSPVELGKEGLPGALRRLADETSSVYGMACLFHQKDENHPPVKVSHHLYAIALESVNNAIKHGKAKEIVIELSAPESKHLLTIEDDGNGFDPKTIQAAGMGLRIMKYRASMIGGELDVSVRPQGGMKVACLFPETNAGT